MTQVTRTIARDATPNYSTLIFSLIVAMSFAKYLGFRLGDDFVKDQFDLNEETLPTASTFGGDVGYLIAFAFVFRLLTVDMMRMGFMQTANARVGEGEVSVKRFLCVTHDPVVSEGVTQQQRWWFAYPKFILRRAITYGGATAVGASAALLLPDTMYAGVDIFEKKNEIKCRYAVAGLMLQQLDLMRKAWIADQRVSVLNQADGSLLIPFVVDARPNPIMTAAFVAGALRLALWGLKFGDQYAEKKYVLGAPLSEMAGGYPFMVILFGLFLQVVAVDAMRFKPMRYLNDRATDVTNFMEDHIGQAVRPYLSAFNTRIFPVVHSDVGYEEAPESLEAGIALPIRVTWNESTRLACARLTLRCLQSYVSLAAAGASIALLPLQVQYQGQDYSKEARAMGNAILMVIIAGMVLSGCRSDQYDGKLEYKEKEEQGIKRFCPGC